MDNFQEKIQNIKLLKELFTTQFIHLSEILNENKDLLQNKKIKNSLEQVKLSLNITKENIDYIKKILNKLSINKEKSKNKDKINNFTKILINLQLLTNIFASEFIYLTKKLESDLKNKNKISESLYNEFKKVDYDIEIISKFIDDLINILNLNDNIINSEQKKKHKGFIVTTIFIKKRFLLAEKIKYLTENKIIKKRAPFDELNPDNLKVESNLKEILIKEYNILKYFRNETFNFWQPVINEVLFYITQKFYSFVDNDSNRLKKFQDEMKQILSKSLLEGINLLTYPQKHTLYNRLKTYANNYLHEIQQKNNAEIRFSELQKEYLKKDEENNREDLNFLPDIDKNFFYAEIITPEEAVIEKENLNISSEFWFNVKKKADELNLIDERNFLENFLSISSNNKLNGVFDFKKDYHKRKIKGSLQLLTKFVESEIYFKKMIY